MAGVLKYLVFLPLVLPNLGMRSGNGFQEAEFCGERNTTTQQGEQITYTV
jgi:hypothetical protein